VDRVDRHGQTRTNTDICKRNHKTLIKIIINNNNNNNNNNDNDNDNDNDR